MFRNKETANAGTKSDWEYTPFGWVDYNEYRPEINAASEKIKQAISAYRSMVSEQPRDVPFYPHLPREVTAYGGGQKGHANHIGVTQFKIDVNEDVNNSLDINGRTALHVAAKMYYETFSYDPQTLRDAEAANDSALVATKDDLSYRYKTNADEDTTRELERYRREIEQNIRDWQELYLPASLKDTRKKIQLLCKTLVEIGTDWKIKDGHGKYAHDYNPSILYYVFLHNGLSSLDKALKFGFECETIIDLYSKQYVEEWNEDPRLFFENIKIRNWFDFEPHQTKDSYIKATDTSRDEWTLVKDSSVTLGKSNIPPYLNYRENIQNGADFAYFREPVEKLELVSPVFDISQVGKLADFMDYKHLGLAMMHTNATSNHVHFSYGDKFAPANAVNTWKLGVAWVYAEPVFVLLCAPWRRSSKYCRSNTIALEDNDNEMYRACLESPVTFMNTLKHLGLDTIASAVCFFSGGYMTSMDRLVEAREDVNNDRYNMLNICNLLKKESQTIEFRLKHGSTDSEENVMYVALLSRFIMSVTKDHWASTYFNYDDLMEAKKYMYAKEGEYDWDTGVRTYNDDYDESACWDAIRGFQDIPEHHKTPFLNLRGSLLDFIFEGDSLDPVRLYFEGMWNEEREYCEGPHCGNEFVSVTDGQVNYIPQESTQTAGGNQNKGWAGTFALSVLSGIVCTMAFVGSMYK